MPIFTTATDADGIATITWDLPGKSMNVLTEAGIAELDAAVDAALADPARQGHRHHLGQARLRRRHGPERARRHEGARRRRPGPRPLRRHHGDAPPAAEDRARRHGPEDPEGRQAGRLRPRRASRPASAPRSRLACHRRFMADNPKARIGLPEILIGIFPGAGGTTRLVRMMGPMAAAPLLLEGKMLGPRRRQGRRPDRRGRRRPTPSSPPPRRG